MGPEFNLEVAYFLDRSLHFTKETLELDHIWKFWVYMFVILVILLDVLLNDVFVSKYCELLL